ncbi:MAG: hypothetical protein II135_10015, partial [Clostridia bacterium]|nr:hypothetical protein [Clostridia bacterium]
EHLNVLTHQYASAEFEKFRLYFGEHQCAPSSHIQAISKSLYDWNMILEITSGYSTSSYSEEDAKEHAGDQEYMDTAYQRLSLKAAIIRYGLEAELHPDRKRYSFENDDGVRRQNLDELSELYGLMSLYNPSFDPPPLPSSVGVNTMNSGGCYIATAVYGSYDCPQVWTLRRFRDYTLAKTWYGRTFIRLYYAISPTLVKWFGKTEWFRNLWKPKLDRLVNKLTAKGVENTRYNDKIW